MLEAAAMRAIAEGGFDERLLDALGEAFCQRPIVGREERAQQAGVGNVEVGGQPSSSLSAEDLRMPPRDTSYFALERTLLFIPVSQLRKELVEVHYDKTICPS